MTSFSQLNLQPLPQYGPPSAASAYEWGRISELGAAMIRPGNALWGPQSRGEEARASSRAAFGRIPDTFNADYLLWKETLPLPPTPPTPLPGLPYCENLPPELLCQIFGHLSDDKRALSVCSLVNRAWFYSSRSFLFRSVEVSWPTLANMVLWKGPHMPRHDESCDAYADRCWKQQHHSPLTRALTYFLEDATELTCSSIRELRLVGWHQDACSLSRMDISDLMRHLPTLRKLSIMRSALRWSKEDSLAFRHLRILEVRDCRVWWSSVFALLTLLPEVEELTWDVLEDFYSYDIRRSILASAVEHLEVSRHLTKLNTGQSLYSHHSCKALPLLVQGLCMRGTPRNLTCLEVDILHDSNTIDTLCTVLRELGTNLQLLRMEISCKHSKRVYATSRLGLKYCTQLRELGLSLPSFWMPDALDLIPPLLTDLWASRDKSVALRLALHFDPDFNNFVSLRPLHQNLAWYLERGLSAVEIHRARVDLDEKERLAVAEVLGPIRKRGALMF